MKDELTDLFQRAVADEEREAHANLHDVQRRSSRHRRARALAWSGAAVLSVLLISVLIPRLIDGPRSDLARTGSEDAGDDHSVGAVGQPNDLTSSRIASFSVRAVAHAGLIDPFGTFYDYMVATAAGERWQVFFDPFACIRTLEKETCNRLAPARSAVLTVVLEDGELRVADASGPMNNGQRASLMSYREALGENVEVSQLEYVSVELAAAVEGTIGSDSKNLSIKASGLWTGPISGAGVASCTFFARDAEGEVVYETELPKRYAPTTEEARAGEIIGTAMPGDLGAVSGSIEC